MALVEAMTDGISIDDLKLNSITWTEEDIHKLEKLIDKAHRELNVKFYIQTKDIKSISTINLEKIKDNKKIYDAFVKKREEHIDYFKKFPKYVKSKLIEHLEESKETLNFDAQKLAKTIQMVEGMSRRHANFIARDQLGKFTASINEAQSEYVGAKEYIWRTVLDNRVRHEHAEREGKKYSYDNPPEGGNPGMDYRCRCTAEAIIHLD